MLRRLFELVVLRLRSERSKELEILVLRHQLHVLQRQVSRPRLRPADRVLLAVLSRSLPKPAWSSFFVSPATPLRWHRRLVARRWTYPRRTVGRPRTDRVKGANIRVPCVSGQGVRRLTRSTGVVRSLERASRRSTSRFFGVIRVWPQHSFPPANPNDPAV
jgi:hypothetical protein